MDCVAEQSAWRGFSLRRQLEYALKFVRFAADVDLSLPNFDVDALLSKARSSAYLLSLAVQWFYDIILIRNFPFSALTLLVGRHQACKKLDVGLLVVMI